MAGDEFAALLGRLKERSGLSYGALGKRLHLSASTLHRYVNGDAVPVDYAPVERLARLCRATPDELVELHRLWVRADVSRQRKTPAPEPAPAPEATAGPVTEPETEHEPETAPATTPAPLSTPAPASVPLDELAVTGPVSEPTPPRRRRGWSRRTAVFVGTAVAAAAVSVALVVSLTRGNGEGDGSVGQAGGTGRPTTAAGPSAPARQPTTTPGTGSPAASTPPGKGTEPTPSAPAAPSGGPSTSAGALGRSDGKAVATAPTVATAPYTWEGPCTQHYLIDREPEQVPPPPVEQDAPGWIPVLGAVSAGEQLIRLTVQGTGPGTVVLEDLHVRVVSKGAPLAWNDYVMGVGCGGEVSTKSFDVDLDAARPTVTAVAGQRKFPYKVSEKDPEVFLVKARVQAHDVNWYLELTWSSGAKRETLRIDDEGRPFHTSGNLARPAYAYPLGWTEWIDNPPQ
ncbi:helix-turn-helix domain-containing protein [Streptomyces venezuelae]|uniref:helix-turn-helix domain-containing protein n=1 Tax=Streptomyces venezuelae TaxID=54571 RepID=UPI0036351B88